MAKERIWAPLVRRNKILHCPCPLRPEGAGRDGFLPYFHSANTDVPKPGHEDVDWGNRVEVQVLVEMRRPDCGDRLNSWLSPSMVAAGRKFWSSTQ